MRIEDWQRALPEDTRSLAELTRGLSARVQPLSAVRHLTSGKRTDHEKALEQARKNAARFHDTSGNLRRGKYT